MRQRVSLFSLGVADVEAAYRFYVDGLGWKPTMYVSGEVLFIQVGHGFLLSLWNAAEMQREAGRTAPAVGDQGRAPITIAHNVDSDSEVDEALALAEGAGGAILVPGAKRDWGGYSGYFADPDGYRWEVAHNPGLVFHDDGTVTFGSAQ